MSFEINHYKIFIFIGFFLLMFLLESFKPARQWESPRLKRLATHVGLSLFNGLFHKVFSALPVFLLVFWVKENNFGLASMLGLTGWVEVVVSFVILDLFDYFWHRLSHSIPFLWRFHKVHHSDNHVDCTTSLRFHPGELFISGLAKASWIVVLGPSILAFTIFEIGVSMASQFHHTNIDFPDKFDKFLGLFIVTPRFHTSHHVVSGLSRDGNYSTIFVIWDRLFASWHKPIVNKFGRLGLKNGRDFDLNPMEIFKSPFSNKIG